MKRLQLEQGSEVGLNTKGIHCIFKDKQQQQQMIVIKAILDFLYISDH